MHVRDWQWNCVSMHLTLGASHSADELRLVLEDAAPATQVQMPQQHFDGRNLPAQPVDHLLQQPLSPTHRNSGAPPPLRPVSHPRSLTPASVLIVSNA